MHIYLKYRSISVVILCTAMTIFVTPKSFAHGGAGSDGGGGGNTVGDQLFDDYENSGTHVLSASEVSALVDPILKSVDSKIPEFGKRIRQGIARLIWYREPKPLDQNGICKDGSETGMTPPIGQVVRACQNKVDVRIDEKWFDSNLKSNPELIGNLMVHELLVFQGLRTKGVTEEGVLLISRDVRTQDTDEKKIQSDLNFVGFGTYQTATEISNAKKDLKAKHDKLINEYHLALKSATEFCQAVNSNASIYSKRTLDLDIEFTNRKQNVFQFEIGNGPFSDEAGKYYNEIDRIAVPCVLTKNKIWKSMHPGY